MLIGRIAKEEGSLWSGEVAAIGALRKEPRARTLHRSGAVDLTIELATVYLINGRDLGTTMCPAPGLESTNSTTAPRIIRNGKNTRASGSRKTVPMENAIGVRSKPRTKAAVACVFMIDHNKANFWPTDQIYLRPAIFGPCQYFRSSGAFAIL